MRVQPITEKEAQEAALPKYLLEEGQWQVHCKAGSDKVSQTDGTEYIELILDAWDKNGKQAQVFCVLHPAMPHLIRHAAYAFGLSDEYEQGDLAGKMFTDRGASAMGRTRKQKGYNPKNEISDFMAVAPGGQNKRAPVTAGSTPVADKDIPF